jgi:hypothetical protein
VKLCAVDGAVAGAVAGAVTDAVTYIVTVVLTEPRPSSGLLSLDMSKGPPHFYRYRSESLSYTNKNSEHVRHPDPIWKDTLYKL